MAGDVALRQLDKVILFTQFDTAANINLTASIAAYIRRLQLIRQALNVILPKGAERQRCQKSC